MVAQATSPLTEPYSHVHHFPPQERDKRVHADTMLPLVVLSLGTLLCSKGASATAAPAVTPLAVLPRTEFGPGGSPLSAAECPNLQEASFDS